jgi:hypothetical protein
MLVAALPLIVFTATGCSSSESDATADGANSARDNRRPEEVVQRFCEAFRNGDQEGVNANLTAAARKEDLIKAAKTEAQFSVGKAVYHSESQAEVETKWQTIDERGQTSENSGTWLLRLEPEGWRIFGMKTVESELEKNRNVTLNFEDRVQFARTRQAVYQERVALGLDQEPAAREEVAERPSGTDVDNHRE